MVAVIITHHSTIERQGAVNTEAIEVSHSAAGDQLDTVCSPILQQNVQHILS